MDIKTVSEEIALLFCPHASTKSVVGNIVNLKIEFAEFLMSIYTKAFVQIADKYNINGTMYFSFETDAEEVMSEQEVMTKLSNKFKEKFVIVENEITNDLQLFVESVRKRLSEFGQRG